jgi:hypothetical protein
MKVFYSLLLFLSISTAAAAEDISYPCNYYIETVDIAFNARIENINADTLTEWYVEKNIPVEHLNDHFKIISIIYELNDEELTIENYLDMVYSTGLWCGLKWSEQWESELYS